MKLNILVTCVASQVIPKIIKLIKSYERAEINIIGVDSKNKELAVGAYFCDKFYQVPLGNHPDYISSIEGIVRKENICIIFPGSDEEVIALSSVKSKLKEEYSCNVSCSGETATVLASNKFEMLTVLKQNEIHTGHFSDIKTLADIENFAKQINYPSNPFIIKPKVGRGSKGFKIIRENINERDRFFMPSNFEVTLYELLQYFRKYPEEMSVFFMMEYFPGDKYSTDILIQKGEVIRFVSRNNGVVPKTNPPTQVADIVFDGEIEDYVRKVVKVADFDFFLQVEAGRDKTGRLAYIETNPRLDASLPITMGAGINFYHEMIDYAIDGKYTGKRLKLQSKSRFFRYWEDFFVTINE